MNSDMDILKGNWPDEALCLQTGEP